MAAPVEDPARIDYHAWGVNLSSNNALGLNLNTPFGKNHAIEAAGNHHAVAFDLSLDFGAFPEDDRLLRDNVSFNVAVNAERAGDCQRSFKGYTLIDETCPDFAACALCCCAVPLPRHCKPPGKTPLLYRHTPTNQRSVAIHLIN